MTTDDKRIDSREALLEVARTLFSEKGYEAVSTRDLAEAAGVNLGAIQYHFGSKAKLFVETVRTLMKESPCTGTTLGLGGEIHSKREAVQKLCHFVGQYLDYLLHPQGSQPCRLMFREIFTNTSQDAEMCEALISSVVSEFIRPLEESLVSVIRHIVAGADQNELRRISRSIVGQCTFYVTHRPFIERLHGGDFGLPPLFNEIVEHIARFSLRAMKCDERTIDSCIQEVFSARGKEV